MIPLSQHRVAQLRAKIYNYYTTQGRDLPWRTTTDPYRIVVSEIMLQQTQVDRVRHRYPAFIKAFPTLASLAKAPPGTILAAWQGMGYNRRALALKRLALAVMKQHNGEIPDDTELLQRLPGIGHATASSIRAFAFNRPVVFVETNIRSVFIHEFFKHTRRVNDKQILPLVEQTLDRTDPRRWYNALMDYGVMLKKRHGNPMRKSTSYVKQSRFEGSNRQIRGAIIKTLVRYKKMTKKTLCDQLHPRTTNPMAILGDLKREGLVKERGPYVML